MDKTTSNDNRRARKAPKRKPPALKVQAVTVPAAEAPASAAAVSEGPAAAQGKGQEPHLDASLIADCDEFARLINATNASPEDAGLAEVAHWDIVGRRIIAAPTHTADGLLARVRALAAAHGDFGSDFNDPERRPRKMLAAIMQAADLSRPCASPDAKLVALCAEFDRLELDHLSMFHGPNRTEDEEEQARRDEASGRAEKQDALLDRICAERATTLKGWQAKARSAATYDVEILGNDTGDTSEVLLSSLCRDLLGDYDPIAIVEGRQPKPDAPSPAVIVDTPILELGRRIADAADRMQRYDIKGDLRATVTPDHASLLHFAACEELLSLGDIVCDLPAVNLADVAVQLDAAFVIADSLDTEDDNPSVASQRRLKRVLTSGLRVLASWPGGVAPGTVFQPGRYFGNVWKGDMPPVVVS